MQNEEEMNNEEKAKELAHDYFRRGQLGFVSPDTESAGYDCAIKMAQWKDEQYKIAYVVTRSDLHYDEVEKVFFNKNKAEEYCKSYNEDENNYHRNITKIEVSL